jgi:CsoR family transcriptional regulator, copper-sensing transcriptional repressor
MEPDTHKSLQNRVSRIGGQVEGLRRMIDEGRYCVDILTQIAAVRSALDALGVSVLSDHVKHCVAGSPKAHSEACHRTPEDLAVEVETVLKRFLK